LDLFGLEPPEYYLLVDKYAEILKGSDKLVIYNSHNQQHEVKNLFEGIESRVAAWNMMAVELTPPYPVQFNTYEEEEELLDITKDFL